jgi:nitric oxide reductase NorQ protein
VRSGIDLRSASRAAVVAPLSDDPSLLAAMLDLVDATFG